MMGAGLRFGRGRLLCADSMFGDLGDIVRT